MLATRRPERWLWHPLAPLARSDAAAAVLPPAAANFMAALQLNDLVVAAICSMAVMLSCEQIGRVFRLSGSPALEHTTLPKRERGHKQLGPSHAASHLAQLVAMFALGGVLLGMPHPSPGQGRLVMATFGVVYALQVGGRHAARPACPGAASCAPPVDPSAATQPADLCLPTDPACIRPPSSSWPT
jgi:hypothetical protein